MIVADGFRSGSFESHRKDCSMRPTIAPSAAPTDTGWRGFGAAALGLIVLIALADDYWRANPVFHDHWIYYGFQRNLGPHLRDFPWTYWSTRLPTILPGALLYRLLSPDTASAVLHAGLLAVALAAARDCARSLFGERAGALAVVFAGGHFFFLQGMAGDYTDGYGVCFWLLAAACVLRALRPGPWRHAWAVGAGAAAAGLLLTNFAYGLLLPLIVGLAAAGMPVRRDAALAYAGRLCTGAVLALASLAVVFAAADAWFRARTGVRLWQPNLHFVRNFKDDETYLVQSQSLPVADWFGHAAWLIWPIVATVAGVLALAFARRHETAEGDGAADRRLAWLTLALGGLIGGIAGDVSTKLDSFSRHWYYAVPLLTPYAVLLMAGATDRVLPEGKGPRRYLPAGLLAIGGLAAVNAAGGLPPIDPSHDALIMAATAAAGSAGFGLVVLGGSRRSATALVIGLTLMAAVQAPVRSMFRVDAARPPSVVEFAMLDRCRALDGPARRETARAIEEAVSHCLSLDSDNALGLWYDAGSPMAPAFEMVNASFAYGRILSKDLNDIRAKPLGGMQVGLEPARVVVVLSERETEGYEAARREFQRLSVRARELGVHEVRHGPVRFFLTAFRVEAAPEELAGTQGRVRR
jgi:hypothetical protein